jgi:hypothetical protein
MMIPWIDLLLCECGEETEETRDGCGCARRRWAVKCTAMVIDGL